MWVAYDKNIAYTAETYTLYFINVMICYNINKDLTIELVIINDA